MRKPIKSLKESMLLIFLAWEWNTPCMGMKCSLHGNGSKMHSGWYSQRGN